MDHAASIDRLGKPAVTLPARGARALTVQSLLLVSASFVLPAIAHAAGWPVRLLLPMHWPVILVGLCYGWRSGALVGLAAPGLSFLLSGMPYPPMLPAMTVELAAYGFLAGLFRERYRWSGWAAALAAVVGGRLVFVGLAVATGVTSGGVLPYLQAAVVPGLVTALAQVLVLPVTAAWLVTREGQRSRRSG